MAAQVDGAPTDVVAGQATKPHADGSDARPRHPLGSRRAPSRIRLPRWRRGPRSPSVCAAAMNGVKGEANVVNRRRRWDVAARRLAVRQQRQPRRRSTRCRPPFERSARLPPMDAGQGRLHGHDGALPWRDLVAPLPTAPAEHQLGARASTSCATRSVRTAATLGGIVDRAGRRAVDRCRATRRQARRRVLHGVLR